MVQTRPRQIKGWIAAIILCLAIASAALVPWRRLLEDRLIATLSAQGLPDIRFTLDHVGFNRLVLKNLKSGTAAAPELQDLTLHYSLKDLLSGRLEEVEAEGLTLALSKDGVRWSMEGVPAVEGAPAQPISIPMTQESIDEFPLARGLLRNGRIAIKSPNWRAQMTFELGWEKSPAPKLSAQALGFDYSFGDIKAEIAKIEADGLFVPEAGRWDGAWRVREAQLKNIGADLPPLFGEGALSITAEKLHVEGAFKSEDGAYRSTIEYVFPFQAPEKALITLKQLSLPWMDGLIEARQLHFPIGARHPAVDLTLNLYHVSIESLLRALTGKEMSATGSLSGSIPVAYSEQTGLRFQTGLLQADAPGVIALPPELIPGGHESVIFVREVMSNLHYSRLSLQTRSDQDGGLSVMMSVEGKNPDVSGGRPVKINVHLTGDMLGFVQQNLLWLSDPQSLLKRGGE